MSLLQTALETPVKAKTRKGYDSDYVELAIAWAQGKVTDGQAKAAMGISKGNGIGQLFGALRQAVRDGTLVQK